MEAVRLVRFAKLLAWTRGVAAVWSLSAAGLQADGCAIPRRMIGSCQYMLFNNLCKAWGLLIVRPILKCYSHPHRIKRKPLRPASFKHLQDCRKEEPARRVVLLRSASTHIRFCSQRRLVSVSNHLANTNIIGTLGSQGSSTHLSFLQGYLIHRLIILKDCSSGGAEQSVARPKFLLKRVQ